MKEINWSKGLQGMRHSGEERHLLLEVLRMQQAVLATFSHAVGRPLSQLALLRCLGTKHPSGAGVLAVARELGVNGAAITRHIQELEAEKLVRRRSDATDGRRNYVSLTPRGLKLLAQLHARAHKFEDLLSEGLTADELKTAAKVLAHMRAALSKTA